MTAVMTDLRVLAAETMEWISSHGRPGLEAELYVAKGYERALELREGVLDGIHESSAEGAGLRVLWDGRMGFACAGTLEPGALRGLLDKACAPLEHLEADPLYGFPGAGPDPNGGSEFTKTLWDETLFQDPLKGMLPTLKNMESDVLRADKRIRSVLRLGYGESRGESAIVNSRGVSSWERGASSSVGLSVLSGEGDDIQIGSAFHSVRRRDRLDYKRVAREGAERSVALLGSRKLPGGRRSVIFDPWVAGELLELISSLLSADGVQRGKSLLAGKLGMKVGSDAVTFRDDPRMSFGLGSSLFDDEGQPTRAKTLIEAGTVKEFFYDTYTAKKDGVPGNASAERGSYRGLPSPGSSNFYLAPGKMTRDQLLSDTKDGVLVLEIMGMHMADPISGEFSVGISGLAVESGRVTHPVKNAMISGNILALLERIDAVADDLTFYGGLGSPTFRIAHMTVA